MRKSEPSVSLNHVTTREIKCKFHISRTVRLTEEHKRQILLLFDFDKLSTVAKLQEWLAQELDTQNVVKKLFATSSVYLTIDDHYLLPSQSSRCIADGDVVTIHFSDGAGASSSSESVCQSASEPVLETQTPQTKKRKGPDNRKTPNLMSVSFALSQCQSPAPEVAPSTSVITPAPTSILASNRTERAPNYVTPMTDTKTTSTSASSSSATPGKRRNRNKNKLKESSQSTGPLTPSSDGTPILRGSTNSRGTSKASGFLPSATLSSADHNGTKHVRFGSCDDTGDDNEAITRKSDTNSEESSHAPVSSQSSQIANQPDRHIYTGGKSLSDEDAELLFINKEYHDDVFDDLMLELEVRRAALSGPLK